MENQFDEVQRSLDDFCAKREWEQFHSPKNLSMALAGEVGELIEHFQWLTEKQSYLEDNIEVREQVQEEVADVFLYLLRLCSRLNLDLLDCAASKIKLNGEKYPVNLSRGSASKYTKL